MGGADQLHQLVAHPLGGDDRDPARHRGHRGHDLGRDDEAELGGEAGGAHHAERVVGEGVLRCARGAQHPFGEVDHAAVGVLERPRGDPDGHRVDGEVASAQVAGERVAEVDVGLAGVGVVGLGAVGRDLHLPRTLAAADGAEGATHVPDGVGPAGQQPLGRVGPCARGEVEVVLLPTDHRVADRAADQGQLLAGGGEAGAELVDDGTDPVELSPDAALDLDDRERRQGGVGHDGPVYVPGWLGPATRVGLCPARPRSVLPWRGSSPSSWAGGSSWDPPWPRPSGRPGRRTGRRTER